MIPDVGALAPVPALATFALAAVPYRAEHPVIALLFVLVGLLVFRPLAAEYVRAIF